MRERERGREMEVGREGDKRRETERGNKCSLEKMKDLREYLQ